jgi:hypothetical protein
VSPNSPTAEEKKFFENTPPEPPSSINNSVKVTINIMLIPSYIQKVPAPFAERTIKEKMFHSFLLLLCT